MPREGWKGVNIPEELHEELGKIVESDLEFASIPELIRTVLVRFIKETKKEASG